ncbi:hypothetical protein VTL71DRAFT_1613 [Oculimacula yallundae]|uniref:Uncharacterized protein n=1 Tax=Oculimacula yallundae TaxID=86028 RepID=A0ABR4CDB6_9HELO
MPACPALSTVYVERLLSSCLRFLVQNPARKSDGRRESFEICILTGNEIRRKHRDLMENVPISIGRIKKITPLYPRGKTEILPLIEDVESCYHIHGNV